MRSRIVVALVGLGLVVAATAQAEVRRAAGTGLEPVASVAYDGGTHLALTRIGGRDYAFASSMAEDGVVRVIDVTNPTRPKVVAQLPCRANQAHLQISHDNKTLIIGEDGTHAGDACGPPSQMGFYTVDISNPLKPKPLAAAAVARGAHTTTAHPTKPYVYVSYGDVAATQPAAFEVWSIKDPAKPRHVSIVPVTGYHGPHDIEFTSDGKRAVASSISLIQVLDTSDPEKPVELANLQCPGCSHNHEARFTPEETHVIVSDETPSGPACPLGGLYFYEWDRAAQPYMTLLGQWQPREFLTPASEPTRATMCTSHTFGISPDGTKVAASWHTAGVRVVDISSMSGVGIGDQGTGPREIGWYQPGNGDAFSAKFDRTGRFIFVNDYHRGFEVFRLGG
jgi:hypothetical protein